MTTPPPSLADFLLAKIANDETVARAITGPCVVVADGPGSSAEDVYAEWFDPARVLAECEAKRLIVQQWRDADMAVDEYGGEGDGWPEIDRLRSVEFALDATLRHLAHSYADHPDFRPEWAL